MKRLWGLPCLILIGVWIRAVQADDSTAQPAPAVASQPTPDVNGDFVISPPYQNAPELTVADDVPKGTVHELTMKSEDSKIYPGLKGTYSRKLWVYVPANYKPGTAVPFMVVQDGHSYVKRLTPVLDNLIHQKKLPAMVAVMLDSGGGDGKGSERGLEYDTVSDKYTTFIEDEVLPKVEQECNVKLTKDPEGRASMGGSSGAACAFTMAWFHPELYHKVLSYSGTFVAQQSPDNPESPHGAWEYHEHLIPQSDRKPIRIWMEVGEHDNGYQRDESSYHNWVMANQRMAAALKDKGYPYQYVFANGAGHVDGKVVAQTLPEALLWLWKGYEAK
ncbi:MAG TPA: alpha/beta hydrolase-fold protein [Pirellulales bacterium]|jgi:enterochelin esterase-like enzyme|nr:alpha/beta hydrolase-fold protein [Pirellulales bacterium]